MEGKKQQNKKMKERVEVVGTTTGNNKEEVSTRGRIFEGYVKKKFPKRVVIEFERPVYVKKYERYLKLKTKLHARLPAELEEQIAVGDYVQVRECRPLSKIIHFIVTKKVREGIKKEEVKEKGDLE